MKLLTDPDPSSPLPDLRTGYPPPRSHLTPTASLSVSCPGGKTILSKALFKLPLACSYGPPEGAGLVSQELLTQPNLPGDTYSFFFFFNSVVIKRQVSYFPSSPRHLQYPSPTSQGGISSSPRPRGTAGSPDSPRKSDRLPQTASSNSCPSPSPGPPRAAAAQARPHPPSGPGRCPILPFAQTGLVPLRLLPTISSHSTPAPERSPSGLDNPAEPAGPGSTHPSAREAGELLRRLLGLRLSSPLPAAAVAAAQPRACSRPAPDQLRFTSSPTPASGALCPALTRKQLSRPNNNT